MKRFVLLCMVFLLLPALIVGKQFGEVTETIQTAPALACAVPDELEFSSIEEFLASYQAIRAGNAAGDVSRLAKSVNFLALKELFLPTGIPVEYQIYKITINENFVSIWYLRKEDMTSEEAIFTALCQQQRFLFSFTRWDLENPLDGILKQRDATYSDLLDGTYLYKEPNMFTWSSNREVLFMYTPPSTRKTDGEQIMDSSVYAKQSQFAHNSVVNLLDEAEVNALLVEAATKG